MRRELTARDEILPVKRSFSPGLVTELLPAEPEGLGLLALMLHAEARRRARRSDERRLYASG